MYSYSVLIADDDENLCYTLKEQLSGQEFSVNSANNGFSALRNIHKTTFDIVLLDLNLPDVSGVGLLNQIHQIYPTLPVIILTGENDAKRAVECMKSGAFDYVVKPYIFDELLLVLRRAIEHKDLIDKSSALEKRAAGPAGTKIIGGSPQMRKLLSLTERAAKSDSNILIQGETGTGKELLAEYIHKISLRSNRPFVVINCASLPDQLIESELFGYEKGAFTDARTSKQGLVEIANGGTLFLDEIGEMSLSLQPKLLRFLENGEFRRIGGLNNIHSNVRIISATNRDLMSEVENKLFRKDLLFRLNVVTINLPPLRERPDDIIPLAEHFLQTKSPIRSQKTLSPNARKVLETYTFPGNVRELQHIIERAIIFSEDKFIHAENLFIVPQISEKVKTPPTVTARLAEDSVTLMNDVEKQHIENVLRKNNWDQTLTAAQLGISQKTLYNKIKKYQLRNTTA